MKHLGKNEALLTQHEVKNRVTYDSLTGIFIWKPIPVTHWSHSGWNNRCANKEAGCRTRSGYQVLALNNVLYFAHRVAWLYETGAWPSGVIDHIDGDPANNKFSNLRDSTQQQNTCNAKISSNNTSGVTGVRQSSKGKWLASIMVNRETIWLGSFDDKQKAVEARAAAETFYFGEYHRRSKYV
jgi:hypothetical protein